jgi:type IV pilus assembly protein PilE
VHARKQLGFTLIEIMIVVAIIGILSAIAYPSYKTYTVKSNRAAAQAFMLNVANREEQYLLDARDYAVITSNDEFNTILKMGTMPTDVSKYYTIRVAQIASKARTFRITATPISGTIQAADSILTLDNDGTKDSSRTW